MRVDVESIKKAIDRLYADMSVSSLETIVNLKDIREHIDILIESVAADFSMQDDDDRAIVTESVVVSPQVRSAILESLNNPKGSQYA